MSGTNTSKPNMKNKALAALYTPHQPGELPGDSYPEILGNPFLEVAHTPTGFRQSKMLAGPVFSGQI